MPGCAGARLLRLLGPKLGPLEVPSLASCWCIQSRAVAGGGRQNTKFCRELHCRAQGTSFPHWAILRGGSILEWLRASWTWNGSKGKEIPCTETAKLSEIFTYPKSSSKVPESWKEWRLVMFSWWNCMLSLSGLLVLSSDLWYIFMVLDTFFIMIRLSYHETIRNCEDVSLRERPFQY